MAGVGAGFYQFNVLPGDVAGNVATVERVLPGLAGKGFQLTVLPEMWSCNFVYPELKTIAARSPQVVDRMQEWGLEHRMVLVGSLPELDGDKIYNTSYVVDSTGELAGKYRKIHLFSLHGEHLFFSRGTAPVVCSTTAGRVGIMICYDLRFPELSRRLALDGADIICISALWPAVRIDHWSLFLRSRAIENQLFLIGCNGWGSDGKIHYGGASAIISPTGQVLASGNEGESGTTSQLDLDEIASFRRHITCFADRVPGAYGIF